MRWAVLCYVLHIGVVYLCSMVGWGPAAGLLCFDAFIDTGAYTQKHVCEVVVVVVAFHGYIMKH